MSQSTPTRDSINPLSQQSLRTPPSASPSKPRLLWRGSLFLSDGTELPGLAIVSTIQPTFASSRSSSKKEIEDDSIKDAPFTLSAEQQDDMCLSIEMVRHASLRVVDVVENTVVKDESGKLSLQSTNQVNPSSTSSNPVNAANQNIHVTFEAAGNVRLYIDPDQHSTIAFFDRLFAYDFDSEQKDRLTGNCSTSALIFSLDKSFKDSMNFDSFDSRAESFDVFGDHASTGSAYHINSSGIMEAVVIGMERVEPTSSGKSNIELHIGRKIVKRIKSASRSESQPVSSNTSISLSQHSLLPRPDDPAPRILPLKRTQSTLKPATSLSSLFSRANSFQDHQGTSSKFALPARPSFARAQRESSQNRDIRMSEERSLDSIPKERSNSVSAITKKRGGNHTPGRRGEKRPRNIVLNEQEIDDDPFLSTTLEDDIEQEEDSSEPIKVKKEDPDVLMAPPPINSRSSSLSNKQTSSIEEKNRSLIKKLVHYQLLGKGVERHEPAYAACYGMTCQGATVALRKHVKIELIDRQIAAGIIEKHLEMYL
ncbi:uncharacterized protein FA14DRAFT_190588 [Meira miltonrushii]|uniref:Sld7 C-terminal domain-containing protein n=1 Tax=Meira miltonrushii TaxID=1280837 RepID=A0A316V745_9BASI|nr:uncharacterized protein FA14DRAFT_190588 [Meira miltonrushii]PWN33439.1 hypothetical protein FA14DRAFT_190588 [Meira miltonrushii]